MDEIRQMVKKSGRVSHYKARETIRKKYPQHEIGDGYFRQAIENLVDGGEIRDVHSRLESL